jgi:hypothetical protein
VVLAKHDEAGREVTTRSDEGERLGRNECRARRIEEK